MPWWAREKTRERKEGRHEGFLSAHDWGSEDLEERGVDSAAAH